MDIILIVLGIVFGILLSIFFLHKGSQRWVLFISRIFLGAVFMYSGFVKAVDPLGFNYKFLDYFQAFNMSFLDPLAFPLSVALPALEFLIGFGILFGTMLRTYTRLSALFMSFFTILTFILALTNPVTDCGCFGDALILTNWETFWKNIIIDIPIVMLLLKGKKLISPIKNNIAIPANMVMVALIVYVSIYGYQHLPIMDFRPYKIGNNIQEGMSIPEGAKTDVYKNTFIYKNLETGQEQSFSEAELSEPANNPDIWEYVDSKSELIEEGYHPPIHDFIISNDVEGDITNQVLQEPLTLLCVAYDLGKTDVESFKKLHSLGLELQKEGITVRVLTSALNKEIEALKDSLLSTLDTTESTPQQESKTIYFYEKEGQVYEFTDDNLPENVDNEYQFIGSENTLQDVKKDLAYQFYVCDPITLKTVVRANPGFVLLKQGTVIDKWHFNDWVNIDTFKEKYLK